MPLKALLIDLIRLRVDNEVFDKISAYARALFGKKSRVSLFREKNVFFFRRRKGKSSERLFNRRFLLYEEFNIGFPPVKAQHFTGVIVMRRKILPRNL